jgi:hypothetical protein
MKELLNSFVNWYYKKEYEEYLSKVKLLPIGDAIYEIENIKKKINHKTDLIKKLELELNKRIKPFKEGINYTEEHTSKEIKAYNEMKKIGGCNN